MFIWTGGVPGTGKSTIISQFLPLCLKNQVEVVKFSDLLLSMSRLDSRTQLSQLDINSRSMLSDLVHEELLRQDEFKVGKVQIDDGHFVIPASDGSFRLALPTDERTSDRTLCLVLFDSPTEHIVSRMLKDGDTRLDRQVRYGNIAFLSQFGLKLRAQIDLYRDLEYQAAHQISKEIGRPLYVITNSDNGLNHAVNKFRGLVCGYLSRRLECEHSRRGIESY